MTYFHLELAQHDVILADGLPAETYLDTGPDAVFHGHGSPISLYPDLASRLWDAKACAPLLVTGPVIDSLRQWLGITASRHQAAVAMKTNPTGQTDGEIGMSGQPVTSPEAAATSGETVEQALARAQSAAKARRNDEATAICNEILAKVPGHPAAVALLGMVAANSGRLEDGCRLLEAAVAARPNVPAFRSALGAVYQKLCRMPDALREAATAVNAQSTNTEFLVGLAMIQIDLDQHEQAAITLLRAIGHKQDSPEAHLALAQVLLARGGNGAGAGWNTNGAIASTCRTTRCRA